MSPRLDNVARLASQQEREERPVILVPKEWPERPVEAFHGLAGRFVRKIEPHTEADPVAILVQFLAMIGSLIGRGPHFKVEADEHHLNLFAVLVGQSSKGRKGVSASQAKRLLVEVDPVWCNEKIEHGLSSGEGLIWRVRDPVEKAEPIREKGKPTGESRMVITDPGIDDKRLLVLESEFASVLRVLKREGNTLSATIRNAWDGGRLSSLTKNSPARATGAHISIIGHVTKDELLRYLDSTETANGFGNRFLWCCARRSQLLPEGGAAHRLDFSPEIADLRDCVDFARQVSEIKRDSEARGMWADVYYELSKGKPGLLGSMVGRAEAQTMRLACLYAVLDRSRFIRAEHLLSALSLWTYCEASAHWIFGDALGDPVADEILTALKSRPEGLTKSEMSKLFGHHRRKSEIQKALATLHENGLANPSKEATGGRYAERWRMAVGGCERSERSERSPGK